MNIINKDREIDKKETDNDIIVKRGEQLSFATSFQDTVVLTHINNQNNNIRKDVNYGN